MNEQIRTILAEDGTKTSKIRKLMLKVVSGISVSCFFSFHGDFSTCPSFPPCVFPLFCMSFLFMGWASPKNALFRTCHAALPYRGG